MSFVEAIQLIFLGIQIMFFAGTIYSATKNGGEQIEQEFKMETSKFRDICLYGSLGCMAIILLLNLFWHNF